MLSITLIEALTALSNHETGARKLDQKAREQHWRTVALAIADAAGARASMARAAQARQAERAARGEAATGGRPPTVWYDVAFGSLWAARVQGIGAAYDLVIKTFTENPGNGEPPKQHSLAVSMSKTGMWWRLLDTDMGQHDISVRRAKQQD